jgi:hypothetical protein
MLLLATRIFFHRRGPHETDSIESDIAGIPVGNTILTKNLPVCKQHTASSAKIIRDPIPKLWSLLDEYKRAYGLRANPKLKKCRNPVVWITQTHHDPTRPHTERSHYQLGQTQRIYQNTRSLLLDERRKSSFLGIPRPQNQNQTCLMALALHAYNHRSRNACQLYDLLQTTL